MKSSLTLTLLQAPLHWENPAANRTMFDEQIKALKEPAELLVLPETFSTAFSMNPAGLAESLEGPTLAWMKEVARKQRSIVTGSLLIEEDGKYYNRLIWMQPDGHFGTYNKRHLFSYGGEDKRFTPGSTRLIARVNGWRICTQICYDLRFPVWSRQQSPNEYDVLLYVANWPQRRALAWNTLLRARAIENQCYVVGVNRTGTDENGIHYQGDSQIISPLGEVLCHLTQTEETVTYTLQKAEIESVRTQFPFLLDKDHFCIM